MTASRLQHLVSSAVVFAIAATVTWISFTQQPAEAFLFPRLISIFFVALAAWNLVRAAGGMSKVGDGLGWATFRNMIPGLIVMLIYVFYAARGLGFYLASTITFFTMFTLYDPAPVTDARAWLRRAVVTLIFMGIIYALFALLLKVQTPRGIWF